MPEPGELLCWQPFQQHAHYFAWRRAALVSMKGKINSMKGQRDQKEVRTSKFSMLML